MSNLCQLNSPLNFDGSAILEEFRLPVMNSLCETPLVRRLKGISFLGAIDYAIPISKKPEYLTTRFDHSISVAFLSKLAAEKMGGTAYDISLAVVAGLLHDLGHGPLSHSLEPQFKKTFGVNHHSATVRLISGEDPHGAQLREILQDYAIKPLDVIDVLNGVYAGSITQLFSSAINVDTIEGIFRASTYQNGFELKQSPSSVVGALVDALIGVPSESQIGTLDSFWMLKHQIYFSLIRSNLGVLSDLQSQMYFDEHISEFRAADFFMTDSELGNRYKGLLSKLRKMRSLTYRNDSFPDAIEYQQRTFFVDPEKCLDGTSASLKRRYRQTKSLRNLVLAKRRENIIWEDRDLGLSKNSAGTQNL